jgi:hypothetical protein
MKDMQIYFTGFILTMGIAIILTCSDAGRKIPEGSITLRITGLSNALSQQEFEDIRSQLIIALINKSDYSVFKQQPLPGPCWKWPPDTCDVVFENVLPGDYIASLQLSEYPLVEPLTEKTRSELLSYFFRAPDSIADLKNESRAAILDLHIIDTKVVDITRTFTVPKDAFVE